MSNNLTSFFLFLIFISIYGCSKDESFTPVSGNRSVPLNEMITAGKKLEDPYSINNMRKAYSAMKQAKSDVPDIELEPTHLYLRFLPHNREELDILQKDTTLALFDFPLDYEINTGTSYKDPSVADSSLTWQYCVIPRDHTIPDVYHEILYEVLLPPDSSSAKSDLPVFWEDLEYESMRMTGNIPEEEAMAVTKGLLPDKWTPSGTIRVWDDVLGYIPLQGASVHARWFTHVETCLTDADGRFATGRFRYQVNYAIKWERSLFDIRNGRFLQAWYNGPKKKGSWELDIRGGESLAYATIHRAAFKHFYGDNLGLNRPFDPIGGKTKICYIDKFGTGEFMGDFTFSGIFPEIKIWGKDDLGERRPTDRIFGIVSHELGHKSHSLLLSNVRYWQVSKFIYESWAEAVELFFTNDEYNKLGKKYFGRHFRYYYPYSNEYTWPDVGSKEYSPIFIDLIDNTNQCTNKNPGAPYDDVSGYTLKFINDNILGNSFGLNSLYTGVKQHKIENVSDSQIDNLFSLYW